MKTRKIWAISIVAILVLGVGLITALASDNETEPSSSESYASAYIRNITNNVAVLNPQIEKTNNSTTCTVHISPEAHGLSKEEFEIYAAIMTERYGEGVGLLPEGYIEKITNSVADLNPQIEKTGNSTTCTVHISPEAHGLSKEEFEIYAAIMAERYGEAAEPLLSGPDTQNLEYIDAWAMHIDLEDGNGDIIAESDNVLKLYRFKDYVDGSGRAHYYYWHWTSAHDLVEGWWTTDLNNFWNRIDLQSGEYMLDYRPEQDIQGNGQDVTIALSAGYGGVNFGISSTFTLFQDTVRPQLGGCYVGNGGMFTVEWIGDYEGTQAIHGTDEIAVVPGGYTNIWTCSLSAG